MRALVCGFATLLLVTTIGRADTFEDAQKAFKQQKYKQTIKLLDDHLKENKDDAKGYILRAQARVATESFDKALEDFTKTIELTPKNALAYDRRGKVYIQDLKIEKALADFDKAVELNPKSAVFLVDRGNAHLVVVPPEPNTVTKALKDFEQALKLNPKSAGAYIGRGRAVLLTAPVTAVFMRGDATWVAIVGYRPGAAKQALPDLDMGIELGRRDALAYRDRAMCYEALHEYAKEIADRKEVATLNKADGQNLNRLAWVMAAANDPKVRDGKAAVEIATELVERTKGKEPYVLDTLAAAQAEAGDFKAAVATQQKVIDALKPPADSEFYQRLGLYKQNKPYRLPAPAQPPK